MFKVSLYVHWHIVYVFGKSCTLSHKAAYYRQCHWNLLTVECLVICAPLWASVHTKALHFSFLVKESETRLKWSKALEYKTGATLIKVVMFNSILSSASSLLGFYLTEVKFFLSSFNIFILAAHRSFPPPFPCLFSFYLSSPCIL